MRRFRSLPIALALIAILSTQGTAQRGVRFMPGGDLPRLPANPREAEMSVRLIGVAEADSRFGEGVEWEVHLGHGIPFIRFSDDAPDRGVVLGVRGGAFGRFSFETKKRDLISSDWVFEAPLFILQGGTNWIRIRYHHISSHLGDDYIIRYDVTTEGYLRDVFGILAQREIVPGFRVYGGGDFAWNVDPNVNKRWSFTGGLAYDGSARSADSRWYAGGDFNIDEDASWTPRVNLHTSVRLLTDRRENLRLIFEALFGASPQGEFRRERTTQFTVGLGVEI